MVYPDKIIRSSRKTLAVSIDCFGKVTVRAPSRCDDKRIFSFLQEKEAWILRKKAQSKGAGMSLPSENLDGYTFLLLGKPCTIRLYEGEKIMLSEGEILVPAARAKERLTAWLKKNAKRIFLEETVKLAQGMQLQMPSVRVSSARTRWGSCSGKNDLSFSFRLLYAPKSAVQYVIVHELSHIRHKNHSKRFWAEVEKYMPDYAQWRKWLKEHAFVMQIF